MRVEFESDGICILRRDEGTEVRRFATVYEPAFNRQYSQPLSADGSRLLIGTWERGLHCYDTDSGELVWRQGPGRVREVIVFGKSVVVEMHGRGVWQRSLANGEVTTRFSMSAIETFRRIGEDLLFAGPLRSSYYVLELADLGERTRIKARTLNPESCLSFHIDRVWRMDSNLFVMGRESFPHGDHRIAGSREFRRVVADALEIPRNP